MANKAGAVVEAVSTDNPTVDRKIQTAIEGLKLNTQKQLINEFSAENRLLVAEFLSDFVIHENVSIGTKRVYICNLLYLCRFLKNKSFKLVTRDDIIGYLSTLRRPLAADPLQKWINTHNNRLAIYQKFFKWLYFPDLSAKERPTPDVVKDLPVMQKKEKTHVQAKDLWTSEDDAVFLKYCGDPRVALYHMMSLDTSARPHEILAVRIGDIKIKRAGEKMYAEVEVGRGGKTRSRTVPLILSLPYYRAWLERHPEPTNPNSFVFRSLMHREKYRNLHISSNAIHFIYYVLKKKHFPKLLERPDVPPEDKQRIRELLLKPWNPYIRRHTSLTAKAKLVNEYNLRLHAGWTKTSKMVEIYTHELGGESSRAILEAMGILPKGSTSHILQPKQCPHCGESNKLDAKFCANPSCKMVLTYDEYEQTLEENAGLKEDVAFMKDLLSNPGKLKKMLEEAE